MRYIVSAQSVYQRLLIILNYQTQTLILQLLKILLCMFISFFAYIHSSYALFIRTPKYQIPLIKQIFQQSNKLIDKQFESPFFDHFKR